MRYQGPEQRWRVALRDGAAPGTARHLAALLHRTPRRSISCVDDDEVYDDRDTTTNPNVSGWLRLARERCSGPW